MECYALLLFHMEWIDMIVGTPTTMCVLGKEGAYNDAPSIQMHLAFLKLIVSMALCGLTPTAIYIHRRLWLLFCRFH
jgi:hypothetical protein